MATLTMQPIGPSPAPAAQEDQRKAENPAVDAADLSDIDSGWVVLKNSDIVSADLAAAAVSGGQRLGSSTIPSWVRWVIGGVVYTVVPFYNRVRQLEGDSGVCGEFCRGCGACSRGNREASCKCGQAAS
ncbi:hypothetical protein PVAP13_6KG319100 [Panicum virgatum]|uniref:Uncharacterized protein n=1 Tax=Panicum virgatum TaxID=38727 RepID=A0A8T0RGJ0_PANVG|nr:hypothetical protein PVAP13_6KG319100 [Panicum virgatum]